MNELFEKRVPATLFSNLVNEILNEGLIASWDTNKLKEKIVNKLRKKVEGAADTDIGDFFHRTKYGRVFTIELIVRHLTEEDKQVIENLSDTFGYYVSKYTGLEKEELKTITKVQIEPRYPVKINKLLDQMNVEYFFHITPKKHLKKIQERGLITKDSQTTFYHPSTRIYYFVTKRPEMIEKFKQMLSENKGLKPEDMAVLKIKYDSSVEYFVDDTATNVPVNVIAFFTTKPIKFKEVISVEDNPLRS